MAGQGLFMRGLEAEGDAPAEGVSDSFGRRISYLRLSVTDRCNLRCFYCMSNQVVFLPRAEVLSLTELCRIGEVFIKLGIRNLRLTGGEPLVRRDLLWLVERLGQSVAQGRLDELTLTTNATHLEAYATSLRAAGVRRVNVSLDTLDPETFRRIARHGELRRWRRGLRSRSIRWR
jgi:cyclic pyranopterin phosphate synthase